ncbi:hypothetical protein QVD99_003392 [Batrachochytrium dendrobatidis]|nr:hypothetical protein QVD99_007630 [Batrachochytrium dendrobatidis]KAK5670069.1 hypothetical protein QVD99_003392 [Batrachochytrium dendrobatidis]
MTKKEADAMEAKTLLSMKTYLVEKLQASPIDLPTDIYDSTGKQIQEWDVILLSRYSLSLGSKTCHDSRKSRENR